MIGVKRQIDAKIDAVYRFGRLNIEQPLVRTYGGQDRELRTNCEI